MGVVSTAIVTALGTLALIDRNRIEAKADLAAATATANATSVAVVIERVSQVQTSLEEIKLLLRDKERGRSR